MSCVKWFGLTCQRLQMMDYHIKQLFDDVHILEPEQALAHLVEIRDQSIAAIKILEK
jgi:hypothetical protein